MKYDGQTPLLSRCQRCGEPLSLHGAPPPQTRYSEAGELLCEGFVRPDEAATQRPTAAGTGDD